MRVCVREKEREGESRVYSHGGSFKNEKLQIRSVVRSSLASIRRLVASCRSVLCFCKSYIYFLQNLLNELVYFFANTRKRTWEPFCGAFSRLLKAIKSTIPSLGDHVNASHFRVTIFIPDSRNGIVPITIYVSSVRAVSGCANGAPDRLSFFNEY